MLLLFPKLVSALPGASIARLHCQHWVCSDPCNTQGGLSAKAPCELCGHKHEKKMYKETHGSATHMVGSQKLLTPVQQDYFGFSLKSFLGGLALAQLCHSEQMCKTKSSQPRCTNVPTFWCQSLAHIFGVGSLCSTGRMHQHKLCHEMHECTSHKLWKSAHSWVTICYARAFYCTKMCEFFKSMNELPFVYYVLT